ncbi:MAG: DUF2283 domain-containing protein [Desulfobacterales bacterium]|nr:DUF2283 domain-containing protein [Desulfobacterales bacterium]
MEEKLTFKYDREADILYINRKPPYPEQESEEVGDDIIARVNPKSGEVENVEILFFSTRLLRDNVFEVPVVFKNVGENICKAEASSQQ